jgi:hypothetical protein
VSAVGQHDDAELALHLADHQLRVESIGAGQHEHLGRGAAQELQSPYEHTDAEQWTVREPRDVRMRA